MDVQAIISELAASNKNACWAAKLTGDAAELLAGIEAYEDEGNKRLPRKEIAERLNKFGADTHAGKVKAHLNRECKCRPPK